MKTTLDLKELRSRSLVELSKEIVEAEKKISELQFRAQFKKIKNFREIRHLKKRRARIWTILAEQAMAKMSTHSTSSGLILSKVEVSKEAAKESNNDQK